MALATSPPPVSRQRSIPPRTMPYARVPTEPTPGGRSSNPASNPASPSAQLSPSDSAAQTLLASPSPASPDLYIDVDPADTRPHATLAEQYPVGVLTRTSWWATRRWRQWLPVAGIFVLMLVFASIFWVYHKSILAWMEILGLKIRQTGFIGSIVLTGLIFMTAFPPVFGYGMLTTLAGFAYGFPLGFIPCFVGALGGSVACFTLCRRYGQHHLQWLYNWNPHTTAAVRAIEKKGFKLLLLIRLSPYPFNLVNALLSGTQIPVRQFALATALSLIKLNMHVYIGANLTEFSNAMFEQKSPWQIAIMVVGMVVGTGVMVYIYWLTKRAVDVVADIPPEGEEVPMQWISDAASEQVLEVHEEPPVRHSLDEHPLQNSKARRVPNTITNSSWDWDGSEDDDSQP